MPDDQTPTSCPLGVRLQSSEGFGRIEIALLEGVNVNSEAGTKFLNEFSIAIATTDVRDCSHRFRMPVSLSRFFCLRAVMAKDRGWRRMLPFGHVGEYFPWVFLGRCFWPRVAMKKRPASHPACKNRSKFFKKK